MTADNVTIVHGGDLFAAPRGAVLIHSCNCLGSWNSGVAAAFRKLYPGAHKAYVAHCKRENQEELAGTCLLIPPQEEDVQSGREHWVACLFTSVGFGRTVDAPEKILGNTEKALRDLKRQWEGSGAGEWHSAKINSVRFRVPWEQTERVMSEVGVPVVVYEYEEK